MNLDEHDLTTSLSEVVEVVEKQFIEKRLKENDFNRTETAKSLGISLRSLYYKIEKYRI